MAQKYLPLSGGTPARRSGLRTSRGIMHGKNRRAGLGRLPDQTGVVRLSFELASEGWAASRIAVQLDEIDI